MSWQYMQKSETGSQVSCYCKCASCTGSLIDNSCGNMLRVTVWQSKTQNKSQEEIFNEGRGESVATVMMM